jgi:serine protease Do
MGQRIVRRIFAAAAVALVALGATGTAARAAEQWQEPRLFRGDLSRGDRTLRTGEYYDEFTIQAQGGEEITFDLHSRQFDTYLIVIAPDGTRDENDDHDGSLDQSVVVVDEAQRGRYRVMVTSYEEGETGRYELRVDTDAGRHDGPFGAEPIRIGESRDGRLDWTDRTIPSGEYRDVFEVTGRAGDRLLIELAADEFDPYLIVELPDGESLENDDADGRLDFSRIVATLPESGRVRITVTSYEPGEMGRYRVRVLDTTRDGPFTGRPVLRPPAGARGEL